MAASVLMAVDDAGVMSLSSSSSHHSSSSPSYQFCSTVHHLKSRTYLFSKLTMIPAITGTVIGSIF